MKSRTPGFAAVELAVVLAVLVLLLSIALPVIGGVQGNAGVQQSMSNLTMLGLAHVVYAADWNGRQVTWARDDLGVYYGSVQYYNESDACQYDGECQPPLIAGWGETLEGTYAIWAYWSGDVVFWPLTFPPGGGYDGTPLSHHILTTDGILGRDTLGGTTPIPQAARFTAGKPSGPRNQAPSAVIPRIWAPPPFTAQEEGQP